VPVTLANSNASAAQLKKTGTTDQTFTLSLTAGQSITPGSVAAGGVSFDPLSVGSTTVSASASGYIATTAASVTVAITPWRSRSHASLAHDVIATEERAQPRDVLWRKFAGIAAW
jgi:hypothetical protein